MGPGRVLNAAVKILFLSEHMHNSQRRVVTISMNRFGTTDVLSLLFRFIRSAGPAQLLSSAIGRTYIDGFAKTKSQIDNFIQISWNGHH